MRDLLRDVHRMRRYGFTSWLLLVTLLLLWSGVSRALHEHVDHGHGGHASHAATDHEEPHDPPAPLQPDDHDDCAICHLLASVKASTLDIDVPDVPPLADAYAAPVTPPSVTTLDRFGVPSGRGPPHLHL